MRKMKKTRFEAEGIRDILVVLARSFSRDYERFKTHIKLSKWIGYT